ncbi:MAG: hypothetical protein E7232_09950 [Lachnospiraceae bacterium]|nr:hypothetical protein [Lachnospiraceae bacterium]
MQNKISKIYSVLIIILPVLWAIKSPIKVLSMGEFLLLPVMLIEFGNIFFKQKKIRIPRGLLCFYFIPILCTVVASITSNWFSFAESLTVVSRIMYYFLLILIAQKHFDLDFAVKFYMCLSILLSSYLMAQVITHFLFRVDLPILANYPNILFGNAEYMSTQQYYKLFSFRPASLFREPSWFADYICPIIAIILFGGELTKSIHNISWGRRLIYAFYLTTCVILSTSSLGILYCSVIWSCFVFLSNNELEFKSFIKIEVTITMIALVIFALGSEVFSNSLNRLRSGSSIGPRLFRGLIIFSNVDLFHQFFGVGINNIGNFVLYRNIQTVFDETDLNYTVTSTNRLIATGIIGLSALIYFWIIQFNKQKRSIGKVLMLMMGISFIFANGEYLYGFAFLFIIIEGFYRKSVFDGISHFVA